MHEPSPPPKKKLPAACASWAGCDRAAGRSWNPRIAGDVQQCGGQHPSPHHHQTIAATLPEHTMIRDSHLDQTQDQQPAVPPTGSRGNRHRCVTTQAVVGVLHST